MAIVIIKTIIIEHTSSQKKKNLVNIFIVFNTLEFFQNEKQYIRYINIIHLLIIFRIFTL